MKTKIGFPDRLSLNAGQKYCRMLQESILQSFRLSLSYHLSLRPLFYLFLSGNSRQVLLYIKYIEIIMQNKVLLLCPYLNVTRILQICKKLEWIP